MHDDEDLPRRIILSRKGLDSTAGNFASPILDGKLFSLPIPDSNSGIQYDDLRFPDGSDGVGTLVNDLSRGKVNGSTEVHLDPDLRESIIDRSSPFRAAFGQCGASQSHLTEQNVGEPEGESNDLFLFFGYFRPAEQRSGVWKYVRKGPKLHVIHGWLQLG
jgi:hypothetical protein